MRVGIILAGRWWRFSLNLEELGLAMASLGHDVVLVCYGDDAGNCKIPMLVMTAEEEVDPEFWKIAALDVAVCFTNVRHPRIASALRQAGAFVIARVDSDGQFSPRVFPRAAYLRLVTPAVNPWDALKRFRHWMNCYRYHYRESDDLVLDTLTSSDAVAIESTSAHQNMLKFLDYYGRTYSSDRIGLIPHPVSDAFLQTPVVENPPPVALCVGRWEDDQKNARLLRATIRRLLRNPSNLRFCIVGSGSEAVFADLARLHPQVEVLGKVPLDRIPDLMDECRFLLSSSRWEGQPISGLEALCRGRTIVATPLPGFIDMAANGSSGSIASNHTPGALARAVATENSRWESGHRNPITIAAAWRPLVSHARVARDIISLSNRSSDAN